MQGPDWAFWLAKMIHEKYFLATTDEIDRCFLFCKEFKKDLFIEDTDGF